MGFGQTGQGICAGAGAGAGVGTLSRLLVLTIVTWGTGGVVLSGLLL